MAWIEKQQIESTNIDWVAYLLAEQLLIVSFVSGGIYLYRNFPSWQYQDLLSPPMRGITTGKYFKDQVEPYFKAVRLI